MSNPLATTVRVAYATRGEGQLQAPTLATWNDRLAKRFRVGRSNVEVAGSNQIGSPNFAYAPDGTFRGQNRQAARATQLSFRLDF